MFIYSTFHVFVYEHIAQLVFFRCSNAGDVDAVFKVCNLYAQ